MTSAVDRYNALPDWANTGAAAKPPDDPPKISGAPVGTEAHEGGNGARSNNVTPAAAVQPDPLKDAGEAKPLLCADFPVRFNCYEGIKDSRGESLDTTWSLTRSLKHKTTRANKNVGLLNSTVFGNDGTRKLANVQSVTAIWLDFEHISHEQMSANRAQLAPFAYLYYTSYRSRHDEQPEPNWVAHPERIDPITGEKDDVAPGECRARVALLLSRPVTLAEFDLIWSMLNAQLTGVDAKCKDASHAYYEPSYPEGSPNKPILEVNDGWPLDVDKALKWARQAPANTNTAPKAAAPTQKNAISDARFKREIRTLAGRKGNTAAAFERLLRGVPFADPGTRDDMLFKMLGDLAKVLPHADPESIAAHFAASLSFMAVDAEGAPTVADVSYKFARALEAQAATADEPDLEKLNGAGNAERFVREHGENARYCYAKNTWYIWNGKCWAPSKNGEIKQSAKETARDLFDLAKSIDDYESRKPFIRHAHKSNTRAGIDEMLYLAQNNLAVDIEHLDADPYVINAQNGIIDLRTGALMPHDRNALCSRILPVDYDPNATSPLFDSYIHGFTCGDGETAAFVQRAMGCTLFGEAVEKAFFFLWGDPDSQKSTFIELFLNMFGGYGESAAPDTWLVQNSVGGNRGDIVRLAGARYVCSSEFADGSKFNTALLKQVTGGDQITYAAKYENDVAFTPKFGLWLDSNDCPRVRGGDAGLWSRMRRVPCLGVIPENRRDAKFKEKLRTPEVLRAALAWTVRGCLIWQREGLGSCAAVKASVEEYKQEMSGIEEFLDSKCVFSPDAKSTNIQIKEAYGQWCHFNHRERESDRALAKALAKRGCVAGNSRAEGGRFWAGVAPAMWGQKLQVA